VVDFIDKIITRLSIGLVITPIENMNVFKTLMKIKREHWMIMAAVIMVIFITVNRMNVFDIPNSVGIQPPEFLGWRLSALLPNLEGLTTSTGVSSNNQVASSIPMGDVYTMINTVTEPDGTIVTDTLDTEGNYVTTVFNSSSVQANQGGGAGGTSGTVNQPTVTETPAPTVRVITLDRDVANY
jgi:hypothetical protein